MTTHLFILTDDLRFTLDLKLPFPVPSPTAAAGATDAGLLMEDLREVVEAARPDVGLVVPSAGEPVPSLQSWGAAAEAAAPRTLLSASLAVLRCA
jgi:hypothetical protein